MSCSRPGAMVAAAEQETKLADLEEQQLLDLTVRATLASSRRWAWP